MKRQTPPVIHTPRSVSSLSSVKASRQLLRAERYARMLIPDLRKVAEPWMSERLLCRDTKFRSHLQHATDELQSNRVDLRQIVANVLCVVDSEVGFVLRELRDAWP